MLHKSVQTYCPVCKSLLGWREKDSLADFVCQECDVTWYFHPGESKPTNNHMNRKPECGCNYHQL